MKVAAIMMFRDEEDILAKCLAHWQRLGITRFFLCDNASVDASDIIAKQFCDDVMFDSRTDWPYENINILKNRAIATGHQWIFPIDADEFLHLPEGFATIQEWLSMYPNPTPAWGEMPYLNHLPNGHTYWQDPHKKAFGRLSPGWRIGPGNHHIEGVQPTLGPMGAFYDHYSIRSYEQFKKKMLNYMQAFKNKSGWAAHPHVANWERYQREGESFLEEHYKELTEWPRQ